MKFCKLTLLFLICLLHNLQAFNTTPSAPNPPLHQNENDGCTLPAPNSFNVDAIGSNSVTLSWNTVNGAAQYRVRIIDNDNGNVLSSKFVPGNTNSGDFSTAGSNGRPCYGEIVSVCTDGSYDQAIYRKTPTFWPIIIELVVMGYTPISHPSANCTVTSLGCSYTWTPLFTETEFRISYGSNKRSFSVQAIQNNPSPKVKFITEDNANNLKFTPAGTEAVEVYYGPTKLAVLTTLQPANPGSTIGILVGGEIASGATIERIISGTYQDPGKEALLEERNETGLVMTDNITAMPNPFRDALQVELSEKAVQSGADIRLFDLMGAEKRSLSTAAGDQHVVLQTADLAPGVYFLRIDSGDIHQTVKVLKTN